MAIFCSLNRLKSFRLCEGNNLIISSRLYMFHLAKFLIPTSDMIRKIHYLFIYSLSVGIPSYLSEQRHDCR